MKPWEQAGISRATWYRQRPIQSKKPQTIDAMRRLIAMLEAEKVAQQALIVGLMAEKDALQSEILLMKQHIVAVKWP